MTSEKLQQIARELLEAEEEEDREDDDIVYWALEEFTQIVRRRRALSTIF